MTLEELKNMKLHESVFILPEDDETTIFIVRVPNGWIYKYFDPAAGIDISNIFVPEEI